MSVKSLRIAVLIGKGGRLPAILRCVKHLPSVTLSLVISYKKESPGINLAKEHGIKAHCFSWKAWKESGKTRGEYCAELVRRLKELSIDLVIMAGWDVILSKEYFEGFSGKTMNIHPALLPAFAGLTREKAQEEVLKLGMSVTGATLHFVFDDGVDTGPIILQTSVAVGREDTTESLNAKIDAIEDEMLCRGIRLFAEGRIKHEENRVTIA